MSWSASTCRSNNSRARRSGGRRKVSVLLALALAGPAGAQSYQALQQARDAEAFAAAQAARSRDIAVANELAGLQTRLQTDQALSGLAAARVSPVLPPMAPNPNPKASAIDARQLASIPDAALAQSNARILAAAQNRK